jgi:uncharacterized protein YrrD/ElaB/YqjD/DUF883 family membrane-anchored ribosome-binding protein
MEEASSLGTVDQVVVNLAQGQVLGLIINAAGGEQGVLAADLQTIGADVVMVSKREVVQPLVDQPELAKFRRPSGAAPLQVFTTSGRRLGAVSAIYIDPLEKVVTRYEVSGGPLKDMAEGILILPVITGAIHGQDAVIIPDDSVAQEGRETGGLLAKLSNFGQKAKTQYQHASETVEKVVDKGAETLKKDAAVVKEKAIEFTGKAKEKAGELKDQAAETVDKVVDKGAEVLKKDAEVVKEKAAELTGKAKEKAEELKEQAAETVDKVVDKSAETLKKEAAVVKEKAAELTGKAKEKAEELAEKAKDKVGEALKSEDAAPEAEAAPAEEAPAAEEPVTAPAAEPAAAEPQADDEAKGADA